MHHGLLPVAVKMLHEGTQGVDERVAFLREVIALMHMNSPNIVQFVCALKPQFDEGLQILQSV